MTTISDKGRPIPGRQYRLTGASGTPCIMNGNTWAESEVGSNADTAAKIKERIEKYVAMVQSLQYAAGDINHRVVSAKFGPKYAKIILTNDHGGRSVHSFINLANGDVLKPAGWSAPAKHPRANIFADDCGASGVTMYGPVYLR